jgi:glycosyltransferase involved in cell wall biosynthesis
MTAGPVPVVHIITMLELGGAQQNTLHTVASLDRARFAPQLVCGPGGLLDDEARALPDVPVHFVESLCRPIRPARDRAASRAIQALLTPLARDGQVLVHTHSSKAGIVGRWAAHRAGAGPVVHSIHGFGHAAVSNPLTRKLVLATERRMARYTDAFIAVSRHGLDEGERLGLLGRANREVIRSGIDLAEFAAADSLRAEARRDLGLPQDVPVVGMIACLKPQKAPLDFVEMAAVIRRQQPDTCFFIAGDGDLRPDVEARIATLGLEDCFQLLGWRRDIPALLGALDVLMLCSLWEGLPRVCPQAMAAGRAIVASAVDGTPEAVVDGRNGLLFAAGDTAAGATHVLRLLTDPGLRSTLAQAGRQAVGEFDQDTMVRQQEALYIQLLSAQDTR